MLRDKKYQEEYFSNLIGDCFDKTYDGFVCRDNMGKLRTAKPRNTNQNARSE